MTSLATPIPIATTCALMTLMAAKHFGADFVAQTEWMARGKERVAGWAVPLAAHAGLHALGTLAIALALKPHVWWIAAIDFAAHAGIDRGKSMISLETGWSTTDARFWWLMGFDQFLHQVTNIGLVAALLLM